MKSLSIPIQTLLDSERSFKSLMDLSVRGGIEYLPVAETFLNICQTSPERVLSYDTCQEYVEASGNYRCRLLIVQVEDDYVMVFLKVVDPIGGKRRFTFHHPVSLNDSIENESVVFQALAKFDCIRDMIAISTKPVDNFFTDEFYNDRESCQFMFTSKWRSRRGINKYLDIFTVNFNDYPGSDLVEEIRRLEHEWGLLKFGKDKNTYTMEYLKGMLASNSIKLVTVWYKDTLVSFSILREQASGMIRVGISKYVSVFDMSFIQKWCDCSSDEAEIIKRYLGHIFQYRLHEHYLRDKDFKAIFYTGWNGSLSLAEYKSQYYKKRLFYYRGNIRRES